MQHVEHYGGGVGQNSQAIGTGTLAGGGAAAMLMSQIHSVKEDISQHGQTLLSPRSREPYTSQIDAYDVGYKQSQVMPMYQTPTAAHVTGLTQTIPQPTYSVPEAPHASPSSAPQIMVAKDASTGSGRQGGSVVRASQLQMIDTLLERLGSDLGQARSGAI